MERMTKNENIVSSINPYVIENSLSNLCSGLYHRLGAVFFEVSASQRECAVYKVPMVLLRLSLATRSNLSLNDPRL
ncbi:hypothetical protein ABIE59_003362 [Marinobacter sp. MBR-99]|jgi:hypothetical protein